MAYCNTVLCSGSVVAGAIEMSQLTLVATLMKALEGIGHAPTPTVSLPRFFDRPESSGDPTIDQWLSEFDAFVTQCGVSGGSGWRC